MDLFITISSKGWGGMEAYVIRLASGLRSRGHAVTLACPDGCVVSTKAHLLGIETLTLPSMSRHPLGAMIRLQGYLRNRRPQVVHANGGSEYWPVVLSAAMAGTKVVLTRHLTHPMKPLTRLLVNSRVDRMIIPSKATMDSMRASGVAESKLRLVYHGIDPSLYVTRESPSRFREALGIRQDAPVVGIVSNLHRPLGKGHLTLLRSIPLVRTLQPSSRWLVVGEGSLRPTVVRLAEQLGVADHVLFTGWIDPERIPQVLAGLDLFILLPQDQEVFSYAVLEAMAAALPVITSTVGGAKELVVDGLTGYIIEPEDHHALARLTANLLASPQLRLQLGSEGQKRARTDFGMTRFLQETESVYAEPVS